jgi:Glycosyltransferase family 87
LPLGTERLPPAKEANGIDHEHSTPEANVRSPAAGCRGLSEPLIASSKMLHTQMKRSKLLSNPLLLAGLITLLFVIVTGHRLLLGDKKYSPDGLTYTHYNNYVIFKQSYFHLISGQDLYQLYPAEHWDLYKYSPSFALLMAPLAYLPDAIGLLGWNLLNVLLLFYALWKLPFQSDKFRLFAFLLIVIELITSVQNAQSNGLMAGLIVMAFVFLERKQVAWASLMIVLTVFIKVFGLVAFALFLFYPDKVKAILYTLGWTALLAVLPLLVVSFSQLSLLYENWLHLLANDRSISFGTSIAGFLHGCFGIDGKNFILLVGAPLFCLPFLKFSAFKDVKFRLLYLASVLIWIVIFNHKAESPTYVIAVTGVSIWFFSQRMSAVNIALLILAIILTVLSATDMFPRSIRIAYVVPYALKSLPCILIWLKITWDLLVFKSENGMAREQLQGVG